MVKQLHRIHQPLCPKGFLNFLNKMDWKIFANLSAPGKLLGNSQAGK